MPEISRTNLSYRTCKVASQKYTRASQTDEQNKQNEVQWNQ
jgi:hypothetical protein